MSRENVEAVRRSADGWNRGDFDAWLQSPHPEIEFISEIARRVEGAETVWRGTEGMRRFWDEFHSVWDLSIELSEIRDLGDTVVALGRIQTRGNTSGVELESPVGYVFEFDGGLIRTYRAYLDPSEALRAAELRGRRRTTSSPLSASSVRCSLSLISKAWRRTMSTLCERCLTPGIRAVSNRSRT
jgi:ketosteroid isomerase-like protein